MATTSPSLLPSQIEQVGLWERGRRKAQKEGLDGKTCRPPVGHTGVHLDPRPRAAQLRSPEARLTQPGTNRAEGVGGVGAGAGLHF